MAEEDVQARTLALGWRVEVVEIVPISKCKCSWHAVLLLFFLRKKARTGWQACELTWRTAIGETMGASGPLHVTVLIPNASETF